MACVRISGKLLRSGLNVESVVVFISDYMASQETISTFPVLLTDVEAADVRDSRYEGMAARALYVTVNVTLSLR